METFPAGQRSGRIKVLSRQVVNFLYKSSEVIREIALKNKYRRGENTLLSS